METRANRLGVAGNSSKGDVHVVNIEKKFSQFFYANYFWNTM